MRIHSLELNAYGPFGGRVYLDFEELNSTGIFLLNGPTGSGKTSILDAICFALYGMTSTNRPELHSMFAPEDAEPYVVLEFTVRGQRYRVRRSPSWKRPKKRRSSTGSRYVSENAKADLDRFDPANGNWEDLIDTAKEAGSFITDLLGLTREQFIQVMLLPQGEFARFLLASSKDREELLKKLFSTQEFERVQQVLKEMAIEAEAKVAHQQAELDRLVHDAQGAVERTGLESLRDQETSLLKEAFGSKIPAEIQPAPIEKDGAPAEDADFADYLSYYSQKIGGELTRHTTILDILGAEYRRRTQAQEKLEQLAQHWKLHHRLIAEQSRLQGEIQPIAQLKTRVELAQRAAALTQPAQSLARAKTGLAQKQEALETTRQTFQQQVADLTGPQEQALREIPDDGQLGEYRQKLENISSRLEKLRDLEAQQQKLRAESQRLDQEITRFETRQANSRSDEEKLREEINRQESFLAQHPEAKTLVVSAEHVLKEAKAHLADAEKLAQLINQRADLETALTRANSLRQKAEQKVSDLYSLRYRQAAFVLAENLEDGSPCPVCGSADHPHLAQQAEESATVEEKDLQEATRQRSQAEESAQRAYAAYQNQQKRISSLEEEGVTGLETAQAAVQSAREELDLARQLVARVAAAETALNKSRAQLEKHLAAVQNDEKTLAEKKALQQHTASVLTEAEKELAGEQGQLSFAERLTKLKTLARTAENLALAMNNCTSARESVADLEEALSRTLADSGFENLAEAQSASLPAAELTAAQQKIRAHEQALTVNRTRLEAEEQQEIATRIAEGQVAPDIQQIQKLQEAARTLSTGISRFTQTQGYLNQSLAELGRIQTRYEKNLGSFASALEDAQLKRHLADTANGTDSDNTLKMTLTTFVLAAQLAEVARAASLHLERMTHGRYRLKHTDARRGNSKAGLDITVHDSWHSRDRLPQSLSGGETFMASLSLALGLADVVQQRSGGIDIDTLFVDEGFGTLDETTLEEVMNTLDELREGGRVIGLISHVAEMKNRIPHQILLTTSPEGSRLDTGSIASLI